jgi:hypothetical protein
MAQRRMFSLQIVDTDAFLDMSQTAQLLYFHLAMRADDDGFIGNPKKISRIIGSNDDDMKVLFAKRFLLSFDTGVIVIKHWKIHNYIQKDRYTETKYIEEKSQIVEKQNGSYTECIQTVSSLDTQVRLGKSKVRLGKDSIETEKSSYGEFQNVQLSDDERTKLIEALNQTVVDTLISELDCYIESTGKKYKSHYATLQNWARRKISEHKIKSTLTPNKSTADFSK